jgi:hypothetical protein
VISKDETVSVSVLPPHAKPILQPKHKDVRSVGGNVGANTSIALDSASSIHLFKDRSLLDNTKVDNTKNLKIRTTDSIFRSTALETSATPTNLYHYHPMDIITTPRGWLIYYHWLS